MGTKDITASHPLPRVVVAGLGGDSGKTLISLSLLLLARKAGLRVAAFKKGPDYIDAAWLTWASGRPARHLDTWMMGPGAVIESFCACAEGDGLNVVEGNRGLYDGFDARGSHSTAELAKLLDAPVLLVLNATKMTRTAAALVLGCQQLDPEVSIAGVILDQVANRRHESVLRGAIESACAVPVLGAIPRARQEMLLPGRHLGLVMPEEHPQIGALEENILSLAGPSLDLGKILEIARLAPPMQRPPVEAQQALPNGQGLKIGFIRDTAFTFYYPENMEAIGRSGAVIETISSIADSRLPDDLDALYIGGGFPEVQGAALSANPSFLASLREAAEKGLPIYAECGGLMLLARAIHWNSHCYPMSGVLPFDVEVGAAPQGHGYTRLTVDQPNPFFALGTELRGHEFHYSRALPDTETPRTACAVQRGTGTFPGRDGVIVGNVWAAYTHLHALATPEWAAGMLRAAAAWRDQRRAT